MKRLSRATAALACAATILFVTINIPYGTAQAAPAPGTLATQPDSRDFVTKSDNSFSFNGKKLRVGGLNAPGLGIAPDPSQPGGRRVPTEFEIKDLLQTAFLMGSGTVRSVSLGVTAGCAECVIGADGALNQAALQRIDHVLKLARDLGIKVVVPLIGGGGPCAPGDGLDPVKGAACGFARTHGKPDSAFFTDPELRAAFLKVVTGLLTHINAETGLAWQDDPTIFAWENCDRCATTDNAAAVADWTEFVGQGIKATDTRHLYENGAFAGHLTTTPASQLAAPSVDIIGDRVMPRAAGADSKSVDAAINSFNEAAQAVAKTGRVYVIDAYAWAPSSWTTPDDFQKFLDAVGDNRGIGGAFVQSLAGHAERGGFMTVPLGEDPMLYFPGANADGMDRATMEVRARAVRRLCYRMMDFAPPTFGLIDAPTDLAAVHGRLTWRGAAGAGAYSISRSADLLAIGSWTTVCDQCVTDDAAFWQDAAPPAGPVWYRITSANANAHSGIPSPPVRNQ